MCGSEAAEPKMIDYEAEYNNRARVPEHPEIFARWAEAAALYRSSLGQERAEIGLKYGASGRQTIDLFLPESGARSPLALFVHGGYWRSFEASTFSHLAQGLNAHDVAVAVCGYDLCPQVRVGDIIGQIRQACFYLWRRFGRRLIVYGHSAGGHLAACMLATDWKSLDSAAPSDLVPAATAISGVFDLSPLVGISMNADLRLSEAEAADVSPLFWRPPHGRILDVCVGGNESSEFLRQSRTMAERWGEGGVETRYEEIANANHFTVLDPLADPQSAMTARLVELLKS